MIQFSAIFKVFKMTKKCNLFDWQRQVHDSLRSKVGVVKNVLSFMRGSAGMVAPCSPVALYLGPEPRVQCGG